MTNIVVAGLLSALLSALVTISGYLFGRRKSHAEALSSEATATKTTAEAIAIRDQSWMSVNKELREQLAYQRDRIDELIAKVEGLGKENLELRARVRHLEDSLEGFED